MRKIWTIARREFCAMVATKAFLISMTLMPVLMCSGIIAAKFMEGVGDMSDKTLVIVDGTGGELFGDLKKAADVRNAALKAAGKGSTPAASKYILQQHPDAQLADDQRLALSERVRTGKIEAFVEIPPGLHLVDASAPSKGVVQFFAKNAMLSAEKGWLQQAINDAVTARRLEAMKLDAAAVRQATAPVSVLPMGLFRRTSDGGIVGADNSRKMAGLFVPLGFMMLMFMIIMLSAQPLLESAMEEKSGRIAEVLLGSVSSVQLMLGKLLGNVAGSLSVVAIYAAGGYAAAVYNGWTDLIPLELLPWFLIYQTLAVLLFSSIFMAVGAAVSQLKEAQSMLLPVWLLMAVPMFVWLQIVREPNGDIATWMSFFPPAAPMAMVLRLSSEAVIPRWHIAASLVLLIAATAACIFLAGRVFRVGILWQGKSPKFREILRWALRG